MKHNPDRDKRFFVKIIFFYMGAVGIVLLVALTVTAGRQIPGPPVTPVGQDFFSQMSPAWTFTADEVVIGTPIISGDRVIVHTTSALCSLSLDTGHVIWRTESPGTAGLTIPPATDGEYVAVPETGGALAVFSADSGKLLWRTCPNELGSCQFERLHSLIVAHGNVYVSVDIKRGYIAYRLLNGERRWSTKFWAWSAQPAADDRYVFLNDHNMIYVLDPETGDEVRSIPVNGDSAGDIIIDQGTLYMVRWPAGSGSEVEALSLAEDKVKWTVPLEEWGRMIHLTLSDDTLYIVADKRLYAFDRTTGHRRWRSDLLEAEQRPAASGVRAYLHAERTLYTFDSMTGEELGTLDVGNGASNGYADFKVNPATNGDWLIIPIGSRQILAYREP